MPLASHPRKADASHDDDHKGAAAVAAPSLPRACSEEAGMNKNCTTYAPGEVAFDQLQLPAAHWAALDEQGFVRASGPNVAEVHALALDLKVPGLCLQMASTDESEAYFRGEGDLDIVIE